VEISPEVHNPSNALIVIISILPDKIITLLNECPTSANAFPPIVVTDLPITNFSMDVEANDRSPIATTLFEIITSPLRYSQFLKAEEPITCTFRPSLKPVTAVDSKACPPITVTELGMTRCPPKYRQL